MRSLIVAMNRRRVIGRAGEIPWRLPADLKRFKRLTMGHCLIMGRRTFESIGRPLPGRRTVVLSRDPQYRPEGIEVARSLAEAWDLTAGDHQPFVVGGGEIYQQALPHVGRIYLTLVEENALGDAAFPTVDSTDWRLVEWESHGGQLPHRFVTYERVA